MRVLMINNSVVRGIGVPNYSNDYEGIISMGIYSPTIITEDIEDNYKPTRLYVKELNGLKYFGKTILKDVLKYAGSGTRWGNQVKKYGKENIKTIWISDWFHCPHHLQEFALAFSELNDVVGSEEWANLTAENGLSGGHFNLSAKSIDERKDIYKRATESRMNRSPEQKQQRSEQHTKTLTANWDNKSDEERLIHATNTSAGLKKMWAGMTDEERTIRKQREMATKQAKTPEELAEISRKQKEARHNLFHRPIVLKLKALAENKGVKLGRNWRAKPDSWVLEQLAQLDNK